MVSGTDPCNRRSMEPRVLPGKRFSLACDQPTNGGKLARKWHSSTRNTRLSGPEGLRGGFSVTAVSPAPSRVLVGLVQMREKPRIIRFEVVASDQGRSTVAGMNPGSSVLRHLLTGPAVLDATDLFA